MIALIELLSDIKPIPVKLAGKIGLIEAFVFSHLVKVYSTTEFDFQDTFSSKFGIRDIKGCINNLIKEGLLDKKESGKYIIKFDKLEDVFYGKTIQEDPELERLITEYISMCRLKGRSFTRLQVKEQLKECDTDKSKKVLGYSISRQFITLYKDGNYTGNSSGVKSGASGGSTQSAKREVKNLAKEI